MNFLETDIQCPYCAQPLTILVEPFQGEQTYVEDCQVCCSPISVTALVELSVIKNISIRRENE